LIRHHDDESKSNSSHALESRSVERNNDIQDDIKNYFKNLGISVKDNPEDKMENLFQKTQGESLDFKIE
jgi:uncharacterized protein YpuA (DUF1002 family)